MTIIEPAPAELDAEAHRRELTAYCYRMLGSAADAQDAVQETMLRAWRGSFDGRSSLRTWLYRVATNVCIDAQRGAARRARPMELGGPAAPVVESLGDVRGAEHWVTPVPTDLVADPSVVVEARDTVRLAFIAALQHLAPKQRAVLILCDVLRWEAAEAAGLLDTTTAAVNSALQRARATMAAAPVLDRPAPLPADLAGLLSRYVAAFERYDVTALVGLLREDATLNMPPFAMWLRGREDIAAWLLGPGAECAGSRLLPVHANGLPAFAQYRIDPAGGHAPWSLTTLEFDGGDIVGMTSFLNTGALFPLFGLPAHLPYSRHILGA